MDAIVRPQLTITQYMYLISYKDIAYKLLLFVRNSKSFREISGMGEWAPPFLEDSSATPSTLSQPKRCRAYSGRVGGGLDANHSQLGVMVMRIILI